MKEKKPIANKPNDKKASFIYAKKTFEILCTGKDKFEELFQKFINKFNPDSEIRDYNFYYDGKEIEREIYGQTLESNKHFSKKESFVISVEKNIKIIQCPMCNYGDCVVSLANYKTIFYNCEHKHLKISSYENYYKDQEYDPSKILCSGGGDGCGKNGLSSPNFCLCLTCSKLIRRTRSICNDCVNKHNKEFKDKKKHKIINYEDKNYYCQTHISRMTKYCFDCKSNLCESCAAEHFNNKENKGHRIKNIDSLIPEEEEITKLKMSLEQIQEYMGELKLIIDNLIYTLRRSLDIYRDYYNNAYHIIKKYETFNQNKKDFKNFTIFKCLYNLKKSNKQILDDLLSVINANKLVEKASKLITIYVNKKDNYYKNPGGDDLNKENDDDWYKEVCENEKRRGVQVETPKEKEK